MDTPKDLKTVVEEGLLEIFYQNEHIQEKISLKFDPIQEELKKVRGENTYLKKELESIHTKLDILRDLIITGFSLVEEKYLKEQP